MYKNFVGTWETVRNREVSVLERYPHGEVRLYFVSRIMFVSVTSPVLLYMYKFVFNFSILFLG